MLSSCDIKSRKEGFFELGEVNYRTETVLTNEYPLKIDEEIRNELKPNFSDSLRVLKEVYLKLRLNYVSDSKKTDNIDTAGYTIVIKNDSAQLLWEIDFDSNLRITRSEEISYEKRQIFLEEGRKMRGVHSPQLPHVELQIKVAGSRLPSLVRE